MYVVLLALGLVYFLSHALAATFSRTNVPDVLVLMLVGIVIGPLAGWVRPEQFGDAGGVLTTIALTVILFESGTAIDARAVVRAAGGTARLTLVTSLVSLVAVALIAWAAGGLTVTEALMTGAILCGTSSAVVIPMVRSLKPGAESSTLLVLESAVSDVLCIVLVFALLDAAATGEAIAFGPLVGRVLASLMFAALIGFAGGVAWLRVWNLVRKGETTVFTTIAAAFVLYGAAEFLGFSGPIAALAYGVTLSNHEFFQLDRLIDGIANAGVTSTERDFYGEIVFLLKTFFFLYLGVSMRFDEPLVFVLAGGVVGAVYLARVVITRVLLPTAAGRRDAALVAVMVPKGLAAAVLAGLPVAAELPGGEHIRNLTYAVVLLSIAATAILVIGLERGTFRPLATVIFRRFAADPAIKA